MIKVDASAIPSKKRDRRPIADQKRQPWLSPHRVTTRDAAGTIVWISLVA
jgi:hypothetical protein